jgi:hypothetical protein
LRLRATFEAHPDVISEWEWLLRAVGFQTFPKSADEFVQEFLELLLVEVGRPTLKIV